MTAPVSRTGATDREVEAQMRERLIEFISWGETDDGRVGYDTARQMLAIYDETVAARVAAAPDSDLLRRALNDPGHFVKRKHDEHESLVDWQVRAYAAALLAEQPEGGK